MYFQLNIIEAAKFPQKSAADTKVLCHSQMKYQRSKASKHHYQCKHIINLWSPARMVHIQLTQKLLLLCTSRWYTFTILNVNPKYISSILPLLEWKHLWKNVTGHKMNFYNANCQLNACVTEHPGFNVRAENVPPVMRIITRNVLDFGVVRGMLKIRHDSCESQAQRSITWILVTERKSSESLVWNLLWIHSPWCPNQ